MHQTTPPAMSLKPGQTNWKTANGYALKMGNVHWLLFANVLSLTITAAAECSSPAVKHHKEKSTLKKESFKLVPIFIIMIMAKKVGTKNCISVINVSRWSSSTSPSSSSTSLLQILVTSCQYYHSATIGLLLQGNSCKCWLRWHRKHIRCWGWQSR